MVKQVISRKGRGSPPLPRQRRALRLVQLTLVAVGLVLALLAFDGWLARDTGTPGMWVTDTSPPDLSEVIGLATASVLAFVGAIAMGLKAIRGPEPPELD